MAEFLLLKGFLLGFCISMPIGPIGILCLRYNLLEGPLAGFFSGLGAATADALYASFAAFGLSFVTNTVQAYEHMVRFFAGLFLIGLSYVLLKSRKYKNIEESQVSPVHNIFLIYGATFLVTLSNPAAILLFMTLFAVLDMGDKIRSPLEAIALINGVFWGGVTAWALLAGIVYWFRGRIDRSFLWKINHYSGLAIGIIGVLTLASLFFSLYC